MNAIFTFGLLAIVTVGFYIFCILLLASAGRIEIYKKYLPLREERGACDLRISPGSIFEDCMPFLCPAQKGKYCQATAIGKLTGPCIVRGRLSHLSSFPESIWAST